jgi:hypothetical protein
MIIAPMLADFATRLAFGLAVALLVVPWKGVPLAFFRTGAQVILGLLVLAALDQAHAGGWSWAFRTLVAGAVLAYCSSVAWGLGLPHLGVGTALGVALVGAGWLGMAALSPSTSLAIFNAASRLASGLLLGATLTAMLLGHYHLTAPAMSIDHLKRLVRLLAGAVLVRSLLAAIGLWVFRAVPLATGTLPLDAQFATLLFARWGMGFLGTAIAIFLVMKTAQISSTQSATGILYIMIIFVIFGELTSMILAGRSGVVCQMESDMGARSITGPAASIYRATIDYNQSWIIRHSERASSGVERAMPRVASWS